MPTSNALGGLLALLLTPLALLSAPSAALAEEGDPAKRRNHVVKVVEKARNAIVSIRTNEIVDRTWYDIWNRSYRSTPYERDGGLGSGAIFHPGGYVITNAHVISRASKIYVGIPKHRNGAAENGRYMVRMALPLAIDIEHDLAILRLLPEKGRVVERYPYISLGRSNDLMLGEEIVAMGHPFRLGLTVTRGIISGVNRKLELGGRVFDDFMQVDAAINPGNSGGPLFDITGRWIGVNTAIYNRAHGAEGIGFAIPADRVRSLIAKAFKRRVVSGDWLGIELEEAAGGTTIVKEVYPKGPAFRSGLRAQDRIIGVAGKRTPSLYEVRMALVGLPPGGAASLNVRRRGKPLADPIRVPLKAVPTPFLSAQHLGFVARDTADSNGVIVTSVRNDGPAAKMKLKPNDLVFALGPQNDPWKIRNTEDLLLFLQFVKPGDLVEVKIQRVVGRSTRSYSGSMKAQ